MTKDELLEHIDESIRTEETASALYLKHMNAIVTRTGHTDRAVAQMKDVIAHLIGENKKHKALLEELRKRVIEESVDVY